MARNSTHEGIVWQGRPLNAGAVTAAVIGNALEWYDFTVFGFMTVVIAHLFFPGENEYSSILLTTAIFGVAFVMRPVGGIVLGLYADRARHKAALSLVIATAGILILAIAPPYSAIGIGHALADRVCAAAAGLFRRRRIRQ